MATTHGAHEGDPNYSWDAEGWWAVSYQALFTDDGVRDLPDLYRLANPDELSAFIAERRREGDETCHAISNAEARALTVAEVHEYRDLSEF